MKSIHSSQIKCASAALFLAFCTSVFSQKNTTWKGGTPGSENDWACPKNWSTYAVPDEFSNVFIPDVSATTLAPPVIKNGRVAVNALLLEPSAQLTVEHPAELVVLERVEGVTGLNLLLRGKLHLPETAIQKVQAGNAAQKINISPGPAKGWTNQGDF